MLCYELDVEEDGKLALDGTLVRSAGDLKQIIEMHVELLSSGSWTCHTRSSR